MKTFILIIFSYLMYQFSYAQWDLIQEPIEGYECFWDIQFVNAEVGYVVGPDIVGKTMDGGAIWTFDYGNIGPFRKVDFIDIDTGVVCCYPDLGDEIMTTFDGGNSWLYPDLDIPYYPTDIELFSNGIGYILDCFGVELFFIKTDNYFSDFVHATLINYNGACTDMDFISIDTGFICGEFDDGFTYTTVENTYDGGLTWNPGDISTAEGPDTKLSFPGSSQGYGISSKNKLWKSWDYGNTWSLLDWDFGYGEDDYGFDFESVYFFTEELGFVITSTIVDTFYFHYEVLRTINGGITWDTTSGIESALDITFENIYCTSIDTCYLTTCFGGIYKTTNGGIPDTITTNVENNFLYFSVSPNPASAILNLKFNISEKTYTIQTTSILGDLIHLNFKNKQADISHLPPGIYFTEVITEQGRAVQKWVKM